MFTIGDLRNIAIQIEKNGEKTYREAAGAATNMQLAEVLTWLADDEKRHAQWFSGITATSKLTAEQAEMESIGSSLLRDIVKGNTFDLDTKELINADTLTSVLTMARALEQDTVLFYEFLLGFLDNDESQQQLQQIIAEEKKHTTALDQLLEAEQSCNCQD